MAIKKPSINTSGIDPKIARALEPIKQNIEMLTGARRGTPEIKGLMSTASSEDIIRKVNEIIARINVSGEA